MASTTHSADATDATCAIATSENITETPAISNSADKILTLEDVKARMSELSSGELFWRDQCQFLKEHGYTLRPRYQPDWKPSWLGTSKDPFECEDNRFILGNPNTMDASRKDGSLVRFKRLHREHDRSEVLFGEFALDFKRFPQNHCLPLLEVLEPPNCEDVIAVMPYLVPWETWVTPFETVGEVVEFFRQIFEGLLFMHDHNIAHTDIKADNIMADALSLFSYPPHPSSVYMKRDFSGETKVVRSRTKNPVKYYLIDFGLSDVFRSKTEASMQPPFGRTENCPEVWQPNAPPCNPFPVDVFCMGNVVREFLFNDDLSIHGPKRGLEFMRELVDDMMNSDPSKRPSMKEVVERYEVIYNGLSEWKLRSPVIYVRKGFKLRKAAVHWTKQLVRMARGIPAIPRVEVS